MSPTDIISWQSLDIMPSEFISWLCCEPLSEDFLIYKIMMKLLLFTC